MGRKHKYPYFHIGKGVKVKNERNKSFYGVANTNTDTYHLKTGKFHSRRKYGKNGIAFVDLDVATLACGHGYDHAHDINVNNKIKPRSDDRPLTKKERRELNRIKNKRKGWKD